MATNPHDLGSDRWNAGRVLRLVCAGLAVVAVVAAVVVVLLPLPHPATGGTCGPGHGSEPAIAAFFDPISIGAGPVPSGAAATNQWLAFVGECQASTNARMVDALALLLLAALFFLVVVPLVRRAWHEPAAATFSTAATAATTHGARPGWYPDPANPTAWRWWDGYAWASEPTPARQDWSGTHTHHWSSGSTATSPPATEAPAAETADPETAGAETTDPETTNAETADPETAGAEAPDPPQTETADAEAPADLPDTPETGPPAAQAPAAEPSAPSESEPPARVPEPPSPG